jgi:hypothetical protein
METAELDRFIDDAKELTKARNARAARDFGLGGHARYHLDLVTQTLMFFDASDSAAVTARIVAVGSLAHASQSWLWSWENESIPAQAAQPMQAVRHFGEKHDIAALGQTFSPCDEPLAWALAAIACKLLDAQGVYRVDQEKTQLFLLLFDLKRIRDETN